MRKGLILVFFLFLLGCKKPGAEAPPPAPATAPQAQRSPASEFSIESLSEKDRKKLDESIPPEVREIIEGAKMIEVYTYLENIKAKKRKKFESFFSANRVAKISNPAIKRRIAEAYYQDTVSGEAAACWGPRHALNIENGKDKLTTLICFECGSSRGKSSAGEFGGPIAGEEESKLMRLLDDLIDKYGKEIE